MLPEHDTNTVANRARSWLSLFHEELEARGAELVEAFPMEATLPDQSPFSYEVRRYQLGRLDFYTDEDPPGPLLILEVDVRGVENVEPLVLKPTVRVFSEEGVRQLIGLFIDRTTARVDPPPVQR